MKRAIVMLAGFALAMSAAAGSGRAKVDYAAYAGESVKEIKYFQLYNWQRSTDKQVVLWTKPSEAYLLTLQNSCDALRGTRVVIEVGGVASLPGRLQVTDDLIVGQMKCRVVGIQPIDLAAVKRARESHS
jgi:hypothetical protein